MAISPYVYVANNPIRYIDPDGRKIGDGKDYFEKIKNHVTSLQEKYQNKKEKFEAKEEKAKAEGKLKKAKRMEKRAKRNSNKADSYQEILDEFKVVEESDVTYNIYTNHSDLANGSTSGTIRFNTNSQEVEILLKGNYSIGTLAHELKHAYQYEEGKISFNIDGIGGVLYDLQDEVEAYARGRFLGSPKNPSIDELKSYYPGLARKTSQRTLDTTVPIRNNPTYRRLFILNNIEALNAKEKPTQYYKGWQENYKADSPYITEN